MSTREEAQFTWAAAASVTVNSSAIVWSDPIVPHVDDGMGWLTVHADNAGTPTSGDTCVVYVGRTTGDVLGDSGADYDTSEHSTWAMSLDTVAANTPGEDPARRTVMCPVAGLSGLRVGVVCAQAASRNIVVRARLSTQRG